MISPWRTRATSFQLSICWGCTWRKVCRLIIWKTLCQKIPFLRPDVQLHHPILPSFASSDDHILASATFGFDIIVWRIIVSIMLTGWLVLEMQNQPVELATTFESDGAVFGNRSRHFQFAQFLPASLAHVSHEYLSHNSHDYASCDSHEYLSHKMRQTATNWPWPLSVT